MRDKYPMLVLGHLAYWCIPLVRTAFGMSHQGFAAASPFDVSEPTILLVLCLCILVSLVLCVLIECYAPLLFNSWFTPKSRMSDSKKRKLPPSSGLVEFHRENDRLKRKFPDLNFKRKPFAEGGGGKIYAVVHDNGTEMPLVVKLTLVDKDTQWIEMRKEMCENCVGPFIPWIDTDPKYIGTLCVMQQWDMDLQTYHRTYNRRLPDHIKLKLTRELGRIHSLDYIHGDIKTTNILVNVSKRGVVSDATLTDFDFTREIGERIDEYCDEDEYFPYVVRILDKMYTEEEIREMDEQDLDRVMLTHAMNFPRR